MRLPFAIPVLLFLLTHTIQAQEAAPFRPASFARGDGSLASLVRCPVDLADQPMVMVICQGQIDESGGVHRPYCIADGDFPLYQRLAHDAFQRATFEPALVGSEPVSVYASFRMAFQHREGGCAVGLLPNKGYLVKEFGLLYTEPQEIIGEQGWNNRDRTSNRVRRQRGGVMLILSSEVDVAGVPGKVKVEQDNFASRSDLKSVRKAAADARFIPGTVNGQPTAMTSMEFFYVLADPVNEASAVEGAPGMSRGNP